ncbi:MAG TPA: carboxypeptidase-like regulatory domain-containing protein [Pirellulales bacterium]|nr:carboxypeptidase-like regulatory domain-containing protein [Pirellulales bacterium]
MSQATFRRRWAASLLPVLCLAWGCSPPPRTVEVVGRVTHNGQPVEGALVVFLNKLIDDQTAHGLTDADGRYHLTTFFSSSDMPRGAVPDREYSVYMEKYHEYDGTTVNKKMAALASAGGDVKRYIREQAVWDLWPDGVPEDWPLDYIPVLGFPQRYVIAQDQESMTKIGRLQRGIPLLPRKYLDPATSGFTAYVERRDEPQVFDFELTGEVEDLRLRKKPKRGLPLAAGKSRSAEGRGAFSASVSVP